MSSPQPERHLSHAAPAAGQADPNPLADAVIQAAIDDAIEKAKRHGTSPRGLIGNTPPVDQPGRPSMSQKATDDSVRMWSFAGSTLLVCGGVALVMVASDKADPLAIGVFCGGVAGIILALKALVNRARRLAPDQHHYHFEGPVYQDQRNVRTKTSGVWATTNNQQ